MYIFHKTGIVTGNFIDFTLFLLVYCNCSVSG